MSLWNKIQNFFSQEATFQDGLFPFHTYIPYEHYDAQQDLYCYDQILGWVAEITPYMGMDETIQKDMQALLEDVLPEGSSLQVLLLADPCTAPLYDDWQNSLRYDLPLLKTMGRKRLDHLSPWPKTRNFRCIISVTLSGTLEDMGPTRSLQRIKDHLSKAMEGQITSLTPDQFIPLMDRLYNLKADNQASNKRWNENELLSHQIMSRETTMVIRPHEVEIASGPTSPCHPPEKGDPLCRPKMDPRFPDYAKASSWQDIQPRHSFSDGGREDDSGAIHLRTYTVTSFPQDWALYGMGALIGDMYNEWLKIQCPFVLHYGIHVLPQEKSQEALFQKMKIIEHQGRSGHLRKVIPKLDKELHDAHHARSQVYAGEKLLWTQFSVGFWDKPDNMDRNDAVIKSLFRSKHFGVEENVYLHGCQYRSWMPMLWNPIYVKEMRHFSLLKTTLSGEASHMLPIIGEWKGTPTKGMPLVGRRGQIFFWHAFDNRCGNYNVIVVGRSGSGKSVFMQELLVNTLRLGGRVFVLDVGRSFEKTCLLLEGQFIAFETVSSRTRHPHTRHPHASEDPSQGGTVDPRLREDDGAVRTHQICLNPFTKVPLSDLEVQDDMFAMMKSLLAMMAAPTQKTSDYENALLEKAIGAAWQAKQQHATVTDVSQWLLGQDNPDANRLGTMLTPFTKNGVYGRYFEGVNNVDFTNPMVVIELEELKEKKDLQGVVLQMFIMTITSQMFLGDRKTPFHICIDEAWDLLRGSQTGPFIETLARRLRKYNGSLVIGTQSIEDFYQTPGAMAAYENSDWMCLLSQKASSVDRLKENKRLTMDTGMEAALKSLRMRAGEYSEVLIYNTQEGYAIGQLTLDPFSALLYSTKADDYEQVKSLQTTGLPIGDALETVLQERGITTHKSAA